MDRTPIRAQQALRALQRGLLAASSLSLLMLGACAELHISAPAALRGGSARFETDSIERGRLVALVEDKGTRLSAETRARLVEVLLEVEDQEGLDPLLVAGLIEQESGWNPVAVSRTGALGLLQLFPAAARDVAERLDVPFRGRKTLLDPVQNVRLGAGYLADMIRMHEEVPLALAAYNIGPYAVQRIVDRGGRPNLSFAQQVLARRDDLRRHYATSSVAFAEARR